MAARKNHGQDFLTDDGSIRTPSVPPDVYVAGLAAATQVYIDFRMMKGRPTAAAIDALVRRSASQQRLSASEATAVHTYLLTSPDAYGVVKESAALATRVLTYREARQPTDLSEPTKHSRGSLDSPRRAQPVTLARDGGTGGANPGPQQLTGPQAVAAAGAANQPVPGDAIEPDDLGNMLLSFGFGVGALGEDLGQALINELGNEFFTNLNDTIITTLSPNEADPPDLSNLVPPDDGQADLPDDATTQDDPPPPAE